MAETLAAIVSAVLVLAWAPAVEPLVREPVHLPHDQAITVVQLARNQQPPLGRGGDPR